MGRFFDEKGNLREGHPFHYSMLLGEPHILIGAVITALGVWKVLRGDEAYRSWLILGFGLFYSAVSLSRRRRRRKMNL